MRIAFILMTLLILVAGCAREDQYFFVFLHTNPDKPEISQDSIMALQNAHLDNITRLAKEGIIRAAGPFEGGGGLFILEADSREQVDTLLSTDPAISADRFKIEIHPMKIRKGNLCKTDSVYTMDFYRFLVLEPGAETSFVKLANDFSQDSIRIIFNFNFTDTNQLVFILKTPESSHPDPILTSPEIKNSVSFSKTLWIARETFCIN